MDKETIAQINSIICKRRDCRKRKGEQCLKYNTNVYLAYAGQCDYGYFGEFKKMAQDILNI